MSAPHQTNNYLSKRLRFSGYKKIITSGFLLIFSHACHAALPQPPETFNCIQDSFIKNEMQSSTTSLQWYEKEVQKRKAIEGNGEEYRFKPLKVTLKNMQGFTEHILENKQFRPQLKEEERTIFLDMLTEINLLYAENEPFYKRTCALTYKFTLLYDFVIQQKMPDPFKIHSSHSSWMKIFSFHETKVSGTPQNLQQICYTPEIQLTDLFYQDWHRLHDRNSTPAAMPEIFQSAQYPLSFDYHHLLEKQELILYPSYEPLDLEDFVGFAHIPVCPVGMITGYSESADGMIKMPWPFYRHDLFHAKDVGTYKHLSSKDPLASPQSRFAFRKTIDQAILTSESIPANHACFKKAITMLLFDILHENNHEKFTTNSHSAFAWLFITSRKQRYAFKHHFSEKYWNISDRDAAMASLWLDNIYHYWLLCGGDILTPAETEYFSQQQFPYQADLLDQHLLLTEEHQTNLIQYLLNTKGKEYVSTNLKFAIDIIDGPKPRFLTAYFDLIQDDDFRQKLAEDLEINIPYSPATKRYTSPMQILKKHVRQIALFAHEICPIKIAKEGSR